MIAVVQQGVIIEQGSHEELVANPIGEIRISCAGRVSRMHAISGSHPFKGRIHIRPLSRILLSESHSIAHPSLSPKLGLCWF